MFFENCQDNVLVLHGWGKGSVSWLKVKEILEKQGYKVLVPDLPGFGSEPLPEKPWSLNDYCLWVKELSEKNSLKRFFLLGHSFGGRVAIKFALAWPEMVRGLILVSAGGIKKETRITTIASSFKKFSFLPGYAFLRNLFYRFILRKTDYLYAQGTMKETLKKVIDEDLTPILDKITASTLIVWGENDKILPITDGRLMKERIKGSSLKILRGIGHAPQIEKPEILAETILSFLRQKP